MKRSSTERTAKCSGLHRVLSAFEANGRGFTLVEILIVLALTMIMMTLFASIFQITANFISKQKGIAENDQSARILTTVLKTDLQARTMRLLAPFHPGMPALADDGLRTGYFYYSENNPVDDTDDVLQFTISLTAGNLPAPNPQSGAQIFGRATFLPLPWQPNTTYPPSTLVRPTGPATATGFVYKNDSGGNLTSGAAEPNWKAAAGTVPFGLVPDGGSNWTTLASPIDQPDGDDAVISYVTGSDGNQYRTLNPPGNSPNNTGASQYAEVSYFLRHGNLCRRVQLIRQPYDNSVVPNSSQPYDSDATPALLIPVLYPPYPSTAGSGNYWTDFDYAARIQPMNPSGGATGVSFLGFSFKENSLDNTGNGTYSDPNGTGEIPIGRPDNRFGFDQIYALPAAGTQTTNGAPREFALQYNSQANTIGNGGNPVYFGRYTQEETSNSAFQFPGALPIIGGTPTSPVGSASILGLDSASYTMWLLNANPPTAETSFAGGSRRGEDILMTNVVSFDVKIWDNRYSENGGSDTNRNGVIDTGPAFADVGHTAVAGDFQQANNVFSVYGPNLSGAYAVPGGGVWCPPYTYTSNGTTYNHNNIFDTWYRYFNFDNLPRTYDAGDAGVLYAPAPYRPRIGNFWQAGHAYAVGTLVDSTDSANGYYYMCTQAGTSGATDPFQLSDRTTAPVTTVIDGGVQWQPQPSLLAVRAIRITVKYLDPTQNLLRQVTIDQSLTQ